MLSSGPKPRRTKYKRLLYDKKKYIKHVLSEYNIPKDNGAESEVK